ncbi:MAG: TetR/AcrR family transcriptional regulator C-terminal ligand-binding domain-containing protein [Pseudonocardia sp.]|nr:TetR/AcrR family transcriptional regulator C-terminal ligand-binding domain-containing protein [Pseudonocardia sp.]
MDELITVAIHRAFGKPERLGQESESPGFVPVCHRRPDGRDSGSAGGRGHAASVAHPGALVLENRDLVARDANPSREVRSRCRRRLRPGRARGDLRNLLDALYREFVDTSAGPAWPFIAARLLVDEEIGDQYRSRLIAPRHRRVMELLRSAVDTGQLPAGLDLNLTATAIAAPATFHPLALGEPAPTSTGRDLLDFIVASGG